MALTLHSYRRCPFAMRVRMVLHEKNLSFTTVEEDLKNFSTTLRKLHPEAKVPLLVHGGAAIYESAVITEYLEDAFPVPSLMPSAAKERAEVRLWTHWCNQTFKPHIDHYKYGEARTTTDAVLAAPENLKSDLHKLETRLQTHQWLVGDTFGLADIHVFPFYRQLSKATPPLGAVEAYPRTAEWYRRIASRDAFEKTMHKG